MTELPPIPDLAGRGRQEPLSRVPLGLLLLAVVGLAAGLAAALLSRGGLR